MRAKDGDACRRVDEDDLAPASQEQRGGENAAGARIAQGRSRQDGLHLRERPAQLVGEGANIDTEGEERAGKDDRREHERDLDRREGFDSPGEPSLHGDAAARNE